MATLYSQLSDLKLMQHAVLLRFRINSPVMYQTINGPSTVSFGIVESYKLNEFNEVVLGIKPVSINPGAPIQWIHSRYVELVTDMSP